MGHGTNSVCIRKLRDSAEGSREFNNAWNTKRNFITYAGTIPLLLACTQRVRVNESRHQDFSTFASVNRKIFPNNRGYKFRLAFVRIGQNLRLTSAAVRNINFLRVIYREPDTRIVPIYPGGSWTCESGSEKAGLAKFQRCISEKSLWKHVIRATNADRLIKVGHRAAACWERECYVYVT